MRSFGFALAAAAALLCGAPASAATMVTTSCDSVFCVPNIALLPFDSSLGTLTGITLRIDVSGDLGFWYLANPVEAPTNSAHVAYDGPFLAVVNGVSYAVPTTGETDITNTLFTFFSVPITGSATFTLDPSLFASFTDQSGPCAWSVTPGICASGVVAGDVTITTDNAIVQRDEDAYRGTYTLTYTYTPFGAVPEPSSWVMMMLGFAAIGIAVRKRHHENSAVISAVIAAI